MNDPHEASSPREQARVMLSGGFCEMDLQSTWRVMGAFNPSRVIGDHAYKKYRPEFAASLACVPEYKSFTVESGDKIAICSDGFRVPTVLLATNAAEAADEMQKELDDRTCVFVNIL